MGGQADAIFVDSAGNFVILDWKRTCSIKFDNAFRSLQEPLQHLPDSNGWLYSLQLNVYKCPAAAVAFGLFSYARRMRACATCAPNEF